MAMQLLPAGVKPVFYDLEIEPNFEQGTFSGVINIGLQVTETIASIKLNVHELKISETTLKDLGSHRIAIAGTRTDRELQTFTIILEHYVPPNTSVFLFQKFSGTLRHDGHGFHVTDGPYTMASTNLEPTYARTVFPCFDHPSFKAPISVTLIVPEPFSCVSNMPIKRVEEFMVSSCVMKRVSFEQTPFMSTYLVAFAVGEFDSIEMLDDRVPVKAYVPDGYDIEHCRFAVQTASQALKILEQLFEINYALPKLDLLLVPGSVGGMENWGLITLSIEAMLFAPDSSAEQQVVVAQLVAHEVAHQWFGNLVSISSWDSYWLKEALSEWAELEIRERMHGDLKPQLEYLAGGLQLAFHFDSSRSQHPLEAKVDGTVVKTPHVDEITYKKGCAVLKMLSNKIGSSSFLQGLKYYLGCYAFNASDTEEFWRVMERFTDLDVSAYMRPWTTMSGYPLVTVEDDARKDALTVTQTPFANLEYTSQNKIQPVFSIPLQILNTHGTVGDYLDIKSKEVRVPTDFYILNKGQIGLYRIEYPPTRLHILVDDLREGRIEVEDRIGLIANTAALVFSAKTTTRMSDLLSMIQALSNEKDFFVWKIIMLVLNEITKALLFEDEGLRANFERFRKYVVQERLYEKGNFNSNDGINEQRFKALLFGNAAGDDNIVAAAKKTFEQFVDGELTEINANVRAEIFKIVLTDGGEKEYGKLKNMLQISSPAVAHDILSSLGYSQNVNCIRKTITQAFSTGSASSSELYKTLGAVTSHKKGIEALWRFLTAESWSPSPDVKLYRMESIGKYVFMAYSTREQLEKCGKFLAKLFPNGQPEYEPLLECIEVRVRWLEREKDDMREWLDKNGFGQAALPKVKSWQKLWNRVKT